jgi:hypothetical protein
VRVPSPSKGAFTSRAPASPRAQYAFGARERELAPEESSCAFEATLPLNSAATRSAARFASTIAACASAFEARAARSSSSRRSGSISSTRAPLAAGLPSSM